MNRYEMINGKPTAFQVETKTLSDIERVIAAGKSAAVIDRYIEMYLLSTDPHQAVKDEWYSAQLRIAELVAITVDETEPVSVFDDAGNESVDIVIVRPGRDLTEDESAEHAGLLARQLELETGLRKETYDAALEAWDGTGDRPAADMQIRDIDLGESFPWLSTSQWPEHVVGVSAIRTGNDVIRKMIRDHSVNRIVVEPVVGLRLQGDEVSQTRMARALVVALGEALLVMAPSVGDITTPWRTVDNQTELVKVSDLLAALRAAGEQQTQEFTL